MEDICCPSCNNVLLHLTVPSNGAGNPAPGGRVSAVKKSPVPPVVKGEAQAVCPHCRGTLTVQLIISPEGEGTYRTVPVKS